MCVHGVGGGGNYALRVLLAQKIAHTVGTVAVVLLKLWT